MAPAVNTLANGFVRGHIEARLPTVDVVALVSALEVLTFPDARLTQRSRPVEVFDDALRQLGQTLADTARRLDAWAISAPQIGHPIRMFVILPRYFDLPGGQMFFCNPEILREDGGLEMMDEGCVSFPGASAEIRRQRRVTFRAQRVSGQINESTVDGILARVFQHEYDHLEGRLIIDHVGPHQKKYLTRAIARAA